MSPSFAENWCGQHRQSCFISLSTDVVAWRQALWRTWFNGHRYFGQVVPQSLDVKRTMPHDLPSLRACFR
jgi:hypothetical protein